MMTFVFINEDMYADMLAQFLSAFGGRMAIMNLKLFIFMVLIKIIVQALKHVLVIYESHIIY